MLDCLSNSAALSSYLLILLFVAGLRGGVGTMVTNHHLICHRLLFRLCLFWRCLRSLLLCYRRWGCAGSIGCFRSWRRRISTRNIHAVTIIYIEVLCIRMYGSMTYSHSPAPWILRSIYRSWVCSSSSNNLYRLVLHSLGSLQSHGLSSYRCRLFPSTRMCPSWLSSQRNCRNCISCIVYSCRNLISISTDTLSLLFDRCVA